MLGVHSHLSRQTNRMEVLGLEKLRTTHRGRRSSDGRQIVMQIVYERQAAGAQRRETRARLRPP